MESLSIKEVKSPKAKKFKKNEKYQEIKAINVEAVLYDVLEKVFKHLSAKDLCRAARVCK